ncbi:MAG: hypothetical protein AAF399_25940 [Bacteroidota bacterium]
MWDSLLQLASTAEFWKFASIPLISALVGYVTNVIALKMTFFPLEFVGVGRLGWQGIIPSRAGAMAGKAVDLLTENLISIEDRFDQIEPERASEELEPALHRSLLRIIEETMEEQAPVLWESVPRMVKNRLLLKAADDLPEVIEVLMLDIKNHISELFDLRAMVVEELESDPELLNQIFLKVGEKEFRFIERSGFYFGLLFGLVQMTFFGLASYLNWPSGWILPTAGLLVGWATNVLALRMIFQPLRKRKVGLWTFQGLFLQRQMRVADAYARIVSSRILTSQNILERLVSGPSSERMKSLVELHVKRAIDETAGISKPLFQLTRGIQQYVQLKQTIAQRFAEDLPLSVRYLFDYAEEALDIENTLRTKMQSLGPVEFVSFLRPVFQEDEWKLILVGAVLGFLAGMAQLILIFGGTLFG